MSNKHIVTLQTCKGQSCRNTNTVKSRFYWVVGGQQKVYKIEIINKIESIYILMVAEGTQ